MEYDEYDKMQTEKEWLKHFKETHQLSPLAHYEIDKRLKELNGRLDDE